MLWSSSPPTWIYYKWRKLCPNASAQLRTCSRRCCRRIGPAWPKPWELRRRWSGIFLPSLGPGATALSNNQSSAAPVRSERDDISGFEQYRRVCLTSTSRTSANCSTGTQSLRRRLTTSMRSQPYSRIPLHSMCQIVSLNILILTFRYKHYFLRDA